MRTSKAWQHRARPEAVVAEIQGRELSDLDTCRRVWQDGGDPLALLEAVRLAGLPEWLTDALLLALSDASFERPMLPSMWRSRVKHARDAHRASAAASARTFFDQIPEITWQKAFALAASRVCDVFAAEPHVSPAAVKKSYQAVSKGLADAHRYYRARPGMQESIEAALQRQIEHLEALKASSPIQELDAENLPEKKGTRRAKK
jgi:hypothetical protein